MITLFTGENSFERGRALRDLKAAFDGEIVALDGSELELHQLPDLLMGATLFSSSRMVIISDLSSNSAVWPKLGEWLERVASDTHLVLVEPKPDKRTASYKTLKKLADVRQFTPWSDRDRAKAESWLVGEARLHNINLDKKCIRALVDRVGVDQWGLYHALQKLAVFDEITPELIKEHIDQTLSENVFNLLEAALKGDGQRVSDMISTLELKEDAYKTFGLLAGQVFQLAALSVATKPASDVAKDIGAHPYALSKLAPYARKLSRKQIASIVRIFADADSDMKMSKGEPWLLIERALVKVCGGG